MNTLFHLFYALAWSFLAKSLLKLFCDWLPASPLLTKFNSFWRSDILSHIIAFYAKSLQVSFYQDFLSKVLTYSSTVINADSFSNNCDSLYHYIWDPFGNCRGTDEFVPILTFLNPTRLPQNQAILYLGRTYIHQGFLILAYTYIHKYGERGSSRLPVLFS